MVLLHCRECGADINSDTKQTKCQKCGTLFPFACAVCAKLLRPPIPAFPIERYFTADHKPLCEAHYQRQCPECQKWFQADENPGYYLCAECTANRGPVATSSAGSSTPVSGSDEDYVLARGDDGGDDNVVERSRAAARSRAAGAKSADTDDASSGTGKKGCGLGMLMVALLMTLTYLSLHALAMPGIFSSR